MTLVPIEDLRTQLRACLSLPTVAERMGISRGMIWQIANEKRWTRGCSPAQRAALAAALARPVYRRRPGPKRSMGLDDAYATVEAASPSWDEYLAKLRKAQKNAVEFTLLPPERRAAAARAPYGIGGEYDPVERALRAAYRADRPSFYRLAKRRLDDAWVDDPTPLSVEGEDANPHEEVAAGNAAEVTNLAKNLKDRLGPPLRALQLAGLVPAVIHRDKEEDSWTPTREELQVRMIPRAELDAWPPRGAPRSRDTTADPPVGDIDRYPHSPQLQKFLSAVPGMRAFRDELQGRRPADPTREALARLCAEIAGAARWARTVERETARAKPVTIINYERVSENRCIATHQPRDPGIAA